ncbi:MAG TPA: DsbC family protein [Thermodesulfovibrionia bacterium]|nr:DsbC family protein [Thermodesulfovibrionia bacterium]
MKNTPFNLILSLLITMFLFAVKPGLVYSEAAETDKCPVHESKNNCQKCHTLTEEEAKKVITGGTDKDYHIQNMQIAQAPVPGFWEVFFESQGKKGIVYVDYTKKYLLVGNLIAPFDKVSLTQEKVDELTKVDVKLIPLDNAIVLGNKDASKKLIVFSDPDCPYCKELHKEMKKVIEKDSDIAFFIKIYPLVSLHKEAYDKSVTIVCEKSLQLLEDNYEGKEIPKNSCPTTAVDDNIKLAGQLGIEGVPAIILPDGTLLSGLVQSDRIIEKVSKVKKPSKE